MTLLLHQTDIVVSFKAFNYPTKNTHKRMTIKGTS